MSELEEALRRVAWLRREVAAQEKVLTERMAELQQTSWWSGVENTKAAIDGWTKDLLVAVEEAKAAALAEYEATENKQPAPGVQIKVYRSASYEEGELLAWCRSNAPTLLALDRRKVEKAAVGDLLPGAPIQVQSTAHAQLASDLSMWDDTWRPGDAV